jgi:hypothetical protein
MNLRPNESREPEENQTTEETPTKDYVKTSVTLSRLNASRAREYVAKQQLLYTQGKRKRNYSFSQFFNDAVQHYLEVLERGETHEENR